MKDVQPEIPKFGGYRKLKSFRMAQLIQDVTERFCEQYIDEESRTYDRMTQAARSAAQKIAGGSVAGEKSKKSEFKLTTTARANIEDLRLLYEDFLRQLQLPPWDAEDPRRAELLARRPGRAEDVAAWADWAENEQTPHGQDGLNPLDGQNGPDGTGGQGQKRPSIPPGADAQAEAMANGALLLIALAFALLDRQLSAQKRTVDHEERLAERLRRRRLADWPE